MNCPGPAAPMWYELRIEGHLDRHWSAWFGGLAVTHDDDGRTTLRGVVTDQSELHGLLAKVRDLGVTLVSVTLLDAGCPDAGTARTVHPPRRSPTPP